MTSWGCGAKAEVGVGIGIGVEIGVEVEVQDCLTREEPAQQQVHAPFGGLRPVLRVLFVALELVPVRVSALV